MSSSILQKVSRRSVLVFVLVVFALATIALMNVSTTEGPKPTAKWYQAMYQAIGLFVVAPMGFPDQGTAVWLVIAWLCYYLAPLATASFLVEFVGSIFRAVDSPARVASRLKGHVIVCGYGKHGRLIVSNLCKKHEVVIVDSNPHLPRFVQLEGRRRIPIVRSDLSYEPAEALQAAGITHAGRLIAATGEDVLNMTLCVAAKDANTVSGFSSIALVADIESKLSSIAEQSCTKMVNTYENAAKQLCERHAKRCWSKSQNRHSVIVIGAGRFGGMMVKALLERKAVWAKDVEPILVIVDLEAEAKWRRLKR